MVVVPACITGFRGYNKFPNLNSRTLTLNISLSSWDRAILFSARFISFKNLISSILMKGSNEPNNLMLIDMKLRYGIT